MNIVRWVLVAGTCVKAVDVVLADAPLVAPLWLLAGLLIARHVRAGFALVAVLAFGGALAGASWASHHTVLLGWVGAAFALFDGADLRLVLRAQMSVLYLFAGLNKLNEHFLTGGVFADRDPWLIPESLWVPAAIAGVSLELFLAAAVWLRWRTALPVAVMLHAGIVAGWMVLVPQRIAQLILFNGLAVALVAASRRSEEREVSQPGATRVAM